MKLIAVALLQLLGLVNVLCVAWPALWIVGASTWLNDRIDHLIANLKGTRP